jgi:hypothetical protein
MSKYADWPAEDSGNIVSARLANEMYQRFDGALNALSFDDQKDASLAELLATTDEVFNVKSFGAVGDGVTDDTAAILAAIAASGPGDTVFLPAGTYSISDTIVIDKAIRFQGSGPSTDGEVGAVLFPSVSVSPVIKVTQDDAQIRGIYVRGFQTADTAIHLSDEVEGLKHIIVEDVRTTRCGTGLLLDVVILSEIRNCHFVSGNVDIQGLATSLTFTSCFVKAYQGTTKGAYHVDGTSGYINFIGCAADQNEGYGYWVGNGSNAVVITGCGAEECALGFARVLGDNVGIYNCHGFSNGDDLNGSTHSASGVTAVGATSLSVVGFQDFSPSGGANRLANHHLNSTTEDCYVRGGLADLGVRDQGARNTVFGLPLVGSETRGNAFNYAGDMFAANIITTDVATLADDATPSVLNGTKFVTGGTTTVTDFDDGVVGQTIEVLSAHAVTITHGATTIVLRGGIDFVMAAGDTLTLTQFATGVWQEVGRKTAGVETFASVLVSTDMEVDGDLNHDGDEVGFYGTAPTTQAAALTAADATAVDSGDAGTDGVIDNIRTRLGEIETALTALGLLGS